MTSPITQRMNQAKAADRAAFIPFITGGFPDYDTGVALLRALDASGADVIEVGIPFSDPVADGPTIQLASKLALDHGATPAGVLRMIGLAAPRLDAALVVMTYWNPVLRYGPERFAQDAAQAGVSGMIVPDLTPEEAGDWLEACERAGIDPIFMAAPTTTDERLEIITKVCGGFLYYVTLLGVTGSDLNLSPQDLAGIERVRQASPLPVAAGFGVSTPEHAGQLAQVCDGVIVGSALIKAQMRGMEKGDGVRAVSELAASIGRGCVRA